MFSITMDNKKRNLMKLPTTLPQKLMNEIMQESLEVIGL